MSGRTASPRLGADVDAWVWQVQTLEDLSAFVGEHGPKAAVPLPVLNWTLGVGREIGADVPSFKPVAERLATLEAYAAALGVAVASRVASDRTVYTVRGRIGRPEGMDRRPRIGVIIQATVWHESDDDHDTDALTP